MDEVFACANRSLGATTYMEGVAVRFVPCFIAALLWASIGARGADPASPARESPKPLSGYSSPEEAFRAMQIASAKRDWSTVFLSMAPDAQDSLVFAAFDACLFIQHKPAVSTALKKRGLEVAKVMGDYAKKYREKHGVDLEKLSEDYKKRVAEWRKRNAKAIEKRDGPTETRETIVPADSDYPTPPQLPAVDGDLLKEVVLRRVTDKRIFYAESTEAITPKRDALSLAPDVGDIEDVSVTGDSAVGWFTLTCYHLHDDRKEAEPPIRKQWHFRKINGRWYNRD